jgi:hypothetical protein
LLGYDSNSHAYHVFNKDSGCVETTCDAVFDETNGSQVKQYDLDVVDDEEAPCEALQRMTIGDVRPQDPSESQAPNDTTPPTQDHEQDQEDEQDEDKAHDQEESIDQGGMRMMGIIKNQDQSHHTQDCTKPYKEITTWIIFLVISKMG